MEIQVGQSNKSMKEEQIKTINDTVSAIALYYRGEYNQGQLMKCLQTIGLPAECIEHIECLILQDLDKY